MKYLVLAFTFLFGSHIAQANTFYLDNGFIAQADIDTAPITGSGNTINTGLFTRIGHGTDEIPVVTISHVAGTFSFNALTAYSFYEFQPVNLAIYNASGLVDSFGLTSNQSAKTIYDYSTNTATVFINPIPKELDTPFIFDKLYTDITYITLTATSTTGYKASIPTTIAAVPEPETYAMLGCGLLMLGALRRKKAAATAA